MLHLCFIYKFENIFLLCIFANLSIVSSDMSEERFSLYSNYYKIFLLWFFLMEKSLKTKHTHATSSTAAKCLVLTLDFASQMQNHIKLNRKTTLSQVQKSGRQSVSDSIHPRYLHRWVTAQGEVHQPVSTKTLPECFPAVPAERCADSCAIKPSLIRYSCSQSQVETNYKHLRKLLHGWILPFALLDQAALR